MSKSKTYGDFYFGIEYVTPGKSNKVDMLFADRLEIKDGVAIFYYTDDNKKEQITFAVPMTKVRTVYAASVIDGSPVALKGAG